MAEEKNKPVYRNAHFHFNGYFSLLPISEKFKLTKQACFKLFSQRIVVIEKGCLHEIIQLLFLLSFIIGVNVGFLKVLSVCIMINEFLFFGGNQAASQFPKQKKTASTP